MGISWPRAWSWRTDNNMLAAESRVTNKSFHAAPASSCLLSTATSKYNKLKSQRGLSLTSTSDFPPSCNGDVDVGHAPFVNVAFKQTDRRIDSMVQESRFTTEYEQELGATAAHEPHCSVWSGKGPLASWPQPCTRLRCAAGLPPSALMESR